MHSMLFKLKCNRNSMVTVIEKAGYIRIELL